MSEKRETLWGLFLNIILTIGVLAIIILISVLAYKPEVLQDDKFKITLFSNAVGLIYLFVIYKYSNIKQVKKKNKGYQKANILHSKMADKVKANNLRSKVEIAIELTNKKNLKEEQENQIEHVTSIFTLDEVLQYSIAELRLKCQEKGFNKRQTRKVVRVANKIKNGKVKYAKYTLHEILNNPTSTSVNKQIKSNMEKWITLWEIISKFVSYVVITAIFAMIDWNDANIMNIVKEIVVRGTLVLSAIQSGLKSAALYVGRSKDRLCNKNDVLAEVEGIDYAQIENNVNNILTQET